VKVDIESDDVVSFGSLAIPDRNDPTGEVSWMLAGETGQPQSSASDTHSR
jgi:hypothetical protein